jgi:hypothetical protein
MASESPESRQVSGWVIDHPARAATANPRIGRKALKIST